MKLRTAGRGGECCLTMVVEDTHHIAQATGMLRNGMDFADALHFTCPQNYPFVTFDKKLKAKAADAGLETVLLL